MDAVEARMNEWVKWTQAQEQFGRAYEHRMGAEYYWCEVSLNIMQNVALGMIFGGWLMQGIPLLIPKVTPTTSPTIIPEVIPQVIPLRIPKVTFKFMPGMYFRMATFE